MSDGSRVTTAHRQSDQPIEVEDRSTRWSIVAISAVAVVAALIGIFLVAQTALSSRPLVGLETEARGETLSVWIRNVETLQDEHGGGSHDDDAPGSSAGANSSGIAATDDLAAQSDGGSYAMPASMMPGTPDEGFQRLQLNLDFINKNSVASTAGPEDFYLSADDGDTWPALRGGSFNTTQLSPGQILNTVLAFDIPESVDTSDVHLVWHGDGMEIGFALESGEGHEHG